MPRRVEQGPGNNNPPRAESSRSSASAARFQRTLTSGQNWPGSGQAGPSSPPVQTSFSAVPTAQNPDLFASMQQQPPGREYTQYGTTANRRVFATPLPSLGPLPSDPPAYNGNNNVPEYTSSAQEAAPPISYAETVPQNVNGQYIQVPTGRVVVGDRAYDRPSPQAVAYNIAHRRIIAFALQRRDPNNPSANTGFSFNDARRVRSMAGDFGPGGESRLLTAGLTALRDGEARITLEQNSHYYGIATGLVYHGFTGDQAIAALGIVDGRLAANIRGYDQNFSAAQRAQAGETERNATAAAASTVSPEEYEANRRAQEESDAAFAEIAARGKTPRDYASYDPTRRPPDPDSSV